MNLVQITPVGNPIPPSSCGLGRNLERIGEELRRKDRERLRKWRARHRPEWRVEPPEPSSVRRASTQQSAGFPTTRRLLAGGSWLASRWAMTLRHRAWSQAASSVR